MLEEILIVLYLFVAVLFMVRTLYEYALDRKIAWPGAFVGCLLCLAWLPLAVALLAYQAVQRLWWGERA